MAIVMSYISTGGKVEVLATINGVLGALVGVTGNMLTTFLTWTTTKHYISSIASTFN